MLTPLLVLGSLALAGCGGGFELSKSDIDRTIVTGAVSGSAPQAGPTRNATQNAAKASDEATIRDAVSSADLDAASGQELAWANVATGSRGAISALSEAGDGADVCRAFTASRESFDGVGLYSGEICRDTAGWQIRKFEAL